MKTKTQLKQSRRARRKVRVRAKISGTGDRPRLAVFKSNKYISAQLIDDEKGVTLAAATSRGVKGDGAVEVGKDIAVLAQEKKIKNAVFDRGGYIFTGRVKKLAEAAREAGLKF